MPLPLEGDYLTCSRMLVDSYFHSTLGRALFAYGVKHGSFYYGIAYQLRKTGEHKMENEA